MTQRQQALAGALAFTAAALLAACQSKPGAGPAPTVVPAEIIVRPGDLTLRAGEGAQLSAQVNDGAGQPIGGAPLAFASADPSVLRVTDRGAVSAVGAAGEGVINVRSGTLTRPVRVTVLPGSPSRIEVLAGADQSAPVAKSLPELVGVKLEDQFGNGLPGAALSFEVDSGGAIIRPANTTTDDRGMSLAAWTLGSSVGRQVLRIQADGTGVAAEVAATATPGSPAQLLKVSGDETSVVAGSTVTLRAQVQDEFGNPVPGVSVDWKAPPEPAVLETSAAATDASGLVAAVLRTPPAAGTTEVGATMTTRAGRKSVAFSVRAGNGPAARLTAAAGAGQAGRAGRAVGVRPAVRVTDANDNPVPGIAVRFAVRSGDGSVKGASQTTSAAGVATVDAWQLGKAPGLNELEATADGIKDPVIFRVTTKR